MVTMTRQPETPARWAAAYQRAQDEGVAVRQLVHSGAWIATSGRDPLTAYELTARSCTCPAGEHGDAVCKHRAALRVALMQQAVSEVEAAGWDASEAQIGRALALVEWTVSVGLAVAVAVQLVTGTDERGMTAAERSAMTALAKARIAAVRADPAASNQRLAANRAARLTRMAAAVRQAAA